MVEGLEYAIRCRRTGSLDAEEQVLLDENELAAGKEFFELRAFERSPDHTLVAYGVNFDGSDNTDIRFRDLERKRDLDDVIPDVTWNVAWASDNRTIFYTARDAALRPHQVWRHRLGDPIEQAKLVFQEDDERFRVWCDRSKNGDFVFISAASSLTSEIHFLRADEPDGEFQVIEPRTTGLEYSVEPYEDRFLITTNADGAVNFKLMTAPTSAPGRANWTELIPHREDARLHGVDVLRGLDHPQRARQRRPPPADDERGDQRDPGARRPGGGRRRPSSAPTPSSTAASCASSTSRW